MKIKLCFFGCSLFLALSFLALEISQASAADLRDDVTPTVTETPSPSATWEEFIKTSTPRPKVDSNCPVGNPSGWGYVTPDSFWKMACSQCITETPKAAWPTFQIATQAPVSTLNPTYWPTEYALTQTAYKTPTTTGPTQTATLKPTQSAHVYKVTFIQDMLSFTACYPNCSNHSIYGTTFEYTYPDVLKGKYLENTCWANGGHSNTTPFCNSNKSMSCYVGLPSWTYTGSTYKRCSSEPLDGKTGNQICQEIGGIDSTGSGYNWPKGTWEQWVYGIGSDVGSGLKCTFKQVMIFYGNNEPSYAPTPTATPIISPTPGGAYCSVVKPKSDDLGLGTLPSIKVGPLVDANCTKFPGVWLEKNSPWFTVPCGLLTCNIPDEGIGIPRINVCYRPIKIDNYEILSQPIDMNLLMFAAGAVMILRFLRRK